MHSGSNIMAASFRGFGTKYFGEADIRLDGSFVTTEFLILLHLPVAPLKSFRLKRLSRGTDLIIKSETFAIVEKLPIQWLQVVRIYLLIICMGGWVIAALWILDQGPDRMGRASVLGAIFIMVASFSFVVGPPALAHWWFKRWERCRLQAANPFTKQRLPTDSAEPNRIETRTDSFHL